MQKKRNNRSGDEPSDTAGGGKKMINETLFKEKVEFEYVKSVIGSEDMEIEHRLKQYNRLKPYCNSVLRIVSSDFNKNNFDGNIRGKIQEGLFKNKKVIDTIFRPDINNYFVINKIINVKKVKFLKSYVLASVYNDKTYLGFCNNCPDMCGINLSEEACNMKPMFMKKTFKEYQPLRRKQCT
jgi:hypothetical protein